jgi:hypothetical protein
VKNVQEIEKDVFIKANLGVIIVKKKKKVSLLLPKSLNRMIL